MTVITTYYKTPCSSFLPSCAHQKSKDWIIKSGQPDGKQGTITCCELENSVQMSHPKSRCKTYFKVARTRQDSLRSHPTHGQPDRKTRRNESEPIFQIHRLSPLSPAQGTSGLCKLWPHFAFNIAKHSPSSTNKIVIKNLDSELQNSLHN